MRLGSEWNRRSFLGSLGVVAGSLMTPRKLFAWKEQQQGKRVRPVR